MTSDQPDNPGSSQDQLKSPDGIAGRGEKALDIFGEPLVLSHTVTHMPKGCRGWGAGRHCSPTAAAAGAAQLPARAVSCSKKSHVGRELEAGWLLSGHLTAVRPVGKEGTFVKIHQLDPVRFLVPPKVSWFSTYKV